MKVLILFVFFVSLIGISCTKNEKQEKRNSQVIVEESDSTIYIKGKEFEGVVFKPSFRWSELGEGVEEIKYPVLLALPENKNVEPWEPSVKAITALEITFHNYWKQAKTDSLAKLNSKVWLPYTSIDRIKRQYVGYISTSGDQEIWSNLLPGYEKDVSWKEVPIIIDGGMFNRSFIYNVKKDSITKVFTY